MSRIKQRGKTLTIIILEKFKLNQNTANKGGIIENQVIQSGWHKKRNRDQPAWKIQQWP